MYLIYLLPVELNDNILIHIADFDLAIKFHRFWVASKLFNFNTKNKVPESVLMNLTLYFTVEKKNNLLFYASVLGYCKVIRLLLRYPKVDPLTLSPNGDESIHLASMFGKENVVALLLLDPNIYPSSQNNKAICWASEYGNEKVVKMLLCFAYTYFKIVIE